MLNSSASFDELQIVINWANALCSSYPLPIASLLEPYAMLWIHLALVQGLGRDIGFALLRE